MRQKIILFSISLILLTRANALQEETPNLYQTCNHSPANDQKLHLSTNFVDADENYAYNGKRIFHHPKAIRPRTFHHSKTMKKKLLKKILTDRLLAKAKKKLIRLKLDEGKDF